VNREEWDRIVDQSPVKNMTPDEARAEYRMLNPIEVEDRPRPVGMPLTIMNRPVRFRGEPLSAEDVERFETERLRAENLLEQELNG
jgi:hypothetical protein